MDSLYAAASRLDTAADSLGDRPASGLDDLAAASFGAEAPGRLGEIGTTLYARLSAALADRRDEAAEFAARLTELAGSLRTASSGYADTDHAVRRRHPEDR